MANDLYVTYQEYCDFGGKVPEDVFPNLERRARRQLDKITFDRVKYLTTIPDVVKEVMVEFIDRLHSNDLSGGNSSSASSYSNGVETVTFSENSASQFNNELVRLGVDWLPAYLTARSVSFDVEEYLQSKSNNT